jgi:toxin ParE1/3/4
MRRYLFTDKANDDLADIEAYLIEEGGVRTARHVLREIKEAINFLSSNPGAGHLREDLTDAPVKFWSVYSYLIVYDPVPRPIEILRIVHASRNIGRLLEEYKN